MKLAEIGLEERSNAPTNDRIALVSRCLVYKFDLRSVEMSSMGRMSLPANFTTCEGRYETSLGNLPTLAGSASRRRTIVAQEAGGCSSLD